MTPKPDDALAMDDDIPFDVEGEDPDLLKATTSWGVGSLGSSFARAPDVDVHAALAPVAALLAEYDAARLKLEREGGRAADVARLNELLTTTVLVEGRDSTHTVSLSEPRRMRNMLVDVGGSSLHLQVRQGESRLPVYYLCRTKQDFFDGYGLLVEDLYLSPGYAMVDPRFAKLMDGAHEVFFLRLSPFRPAVADLLREEAPADDGAAARALDAFLLRVGRHVLQAAWHEDQRLGVGIAHRLDLQSFVHAVECLYLALSGELCEIRAESDPRLLRFFEDVYPQPAILRFLAHIRRADGKTLNAIPQTALALYARLQRAFGQFLAVEIPWGQARTRVPLAKICFANFPRLDLAAPLLRTEAVVEKARRRLDREARAVVRELVGGEEA